MRITIDREKCVGAGQCVLTAPAVFDQGQEDGLGVVRTPSPPESEHERVREAVHLCPARAITLQPEPSSK